MVPLTLKRHHLILSQRHVECCVKYARGKKPDEHESVFEAVER